MQIVVKKRGKRCELTCRRADGSTTKAALGPGLPYHDFAHFVAERRYALRGGFFGNVAAGYSLEALGDKQVIQLLGPEASIAEVLARAVGALATGACRPDEFASLVNEELAGMGVAPLEDADAGAAEKMLAEFRELIARYDALGDGESLQLEFA